MGYTIDIVNKSDNKSFVITRTIDNTDIPSNTTFKFQFCQYNTSPLSVKESQAIVFAPEGLKVASMEVAIGSIKASDGSNFFGSLTKFPDGIATIVMTTTLAGSQIVVISKKMFTLNCKEIIYGNACRYAMELIRTSEKRYTENLFSAYIKLKGMNSSAVTGLEEQLMINLEELQRQCQTMEL